MGRRREVRAGDLDRLIERTLALPEVAERVASRGTYLGDRARLAADLRETAKDYRRKADRCDETAAFLLSCNGAPGPACTERPAFPWGDLAPQEDADARAS